MPAQKPTVRHKLIKKGGRIRSRRFSPGGYDHYKLRLFLDGDTSNVTSVEYELHPTFSKPHRVVTDPAHGFALDIWTWGEFEIPVKVNMRDGEPESSVYDLKYSGELPDEAHAYTNEGAR